MKVEEIGKQIKLLREEKNISQKDFSEMIHISPSTLCRWEKGSSIPPLHQLELICKALDVEPEDIIAGGREEYIIMRKKLFHARLTSVVLAIMLVILIAFMLLPKYRVISEKEVDTGNYGLTKTIYVKPVLFFDENSAHNYGVRLKKEYEKQNIQALEVIFVQSDDNLEDIDNYYIEETFILNGSSE